MEFDLSYLQLIFVGMGGGFMLSGVCWLIGLGYSLAINIFKEGGS